MLITLPKKKMKEEFLEKIFWSYKHRSVKNPLDNSAVTNTVRFRTAD